MSETTSRDTKKDNMDFSISGADLRKFVLYPILGGAIFLAAAKYVDDRVTNHPGVKTLNERMGKVEKLMERIDERSIALNDFIRDALANGNGTNSGGSGGTP